MESIAGDVAAYLDRTVEPTQLGTPIASLSMSEVCDVCRDTEQH